MSYMFAFLLCAIGVGVLIKGFTGQGGGVLLLSGFCLLIGGITVFNNINNDDEMNAEIQALESSLERNVVNEEAYGEEEERDKYGNRYSGEELDFSEVNKHYEQIRNESSQRQQEQQRKMRYEQEERELTMEE